jgi:PAS domain S-box-containing protein
MSNSQPPRAADPLCPPTDIAREQQQLRDAAQARLAAIVESSDDAIVSKTLEGIITSWNKGAERLFGYTAAEAIGRPIHMLVPADRAEEEPSILARLRRGERVDHFETVRVRKDGTHIDVSVTISPIRDHTGTVVGASKIARDVTYQKTYQRELRRAKEAAEQASRAKDQFLSILSHELRTPLTPALAALGLMERRGDLSPQMRGEIDMIRRNVETEARLVDDLLDLTRISRGKIELRMEVTDAHAIVRHTLAMFQQEMDVRGLESSIALRAKEFHVWADPQRLQQVLMNLLSNAVKFTAEGGIVSVRSTNTPDGRLSVEVRDTGRGIEPDVIARLFEPFEQGTQETTRRFGGLGLGLAITKSLVEMHGGTINAQSEGLGRGAVFTVEFATVARDGATEPPAQQPSAAENKLRGLRVLLLEDHVDTRQIMSRLLGSFGCDVTATGTVKEAIALAEAGEYDLLVSDIGLPDGSGMDVMRHLRQRQHDIKGIALSGFGQPEDLRRSQDAGFEMHLTKPVNFRALEDVIQKVTK